MTEGQKNSTSENRKKMQYARFIKQKTKTKKIDGRREKRSRQDKTRQEARGKRQAKGELVIIITKKIMRVNGTYIVLCVCIVCVWCLACGVKLKRRG